MNPSRSVIWKSMGLGGAFSLALHLVTWGVSAILIEVFKNEVAAFFAPLLLCFISIPIYFMLRAKSNSSSHYLAASALAHTLLITLTYALMCLISHFELYVSDPYSEIDVLYSLVFCALFFIGYIIPLIDLICRAVAALWKRLTGRYGDF